LGNHGGSLQPATDQPLQPLSAAHGWHTQPNADFARAGISGSGRLLWHLPSVELRLRATRWGKVLDGSPRLRRVQGRLFRRPWRIITGAHIPAPCYP